jgi:SAM-dependent methyltransferase
MDQQRTSQEQLSSRLDRLLECYLHDAAHRSTAIVPTFIHRLNIVDAWAVPSSTVRLLDIGCGQGDSTLVLASSNDQVHVTGIDSGPADYGSPYTLGQAQAFILASPLGQRITFERADPNSYLRPAEASGPATFDAAFFCLSLWYWSSIDQIRKVFSTLAESGVSTVYVAEWAGKASRPEQEAHALAAQVQKELYALRSDAPGSQFLSQNVRTGLLPDELFGVAAEAAGWKVVRRGLVTPPSNLMDGVWEAGYAGSDDFWKNCELELDGVDAEKKAEILGYRERLKDAVERCGGRKEVKCMDVVWAVLER